MLEKQAVFSDQFLKNNQGFGEYLTHLEEKRGHVPEACTRKGHVTIYIPGTEQMICGVGGFSPSGEEGDAWIGIITTRGGAHLKGEVAHI